MKDVVLLLYDLEDDSWSVHFCKNVVVLNLFLHVLSDHSPNISFSVSPNAFHILSVILSAEGRGLFSFSSFAFLMSFDRLTYVVKPFDNEP